MPAVLWRGWKSRAKGRDWCDIVWSAAYHPELHLAHLEQRMRQAGHWEGAASLMEAGLGSLLAQRIDHADIGQIRREVEPFMKEPGVLAVFSPRGLLRSIIRRQAKV